MKICRTTNCPSHRTTYESKFIDIYLFEFGNYNSGAKFKVNNKNTRTMSDVVQEFLLTLNK